MTLDNEKRTYDANGKITSIDYNTGRFVDPRLTVVKPFREEFKYSEGQLREINRIHADGEQEIIQVATKLPLPVRSPADKSEIRNAKQSEHQAATRKMLREPIPTLTEIREAEGRLATVLNKNKIELLAATQSMKGADLYVALSKLLDREIADGDISATALTYARLVGAFSGNFSLTAERALGLFPSNAETRITNDNITALCKIAIHANQNAIKQNNLERAKHFAKIAISLSRRGDDVSLKRDVIRQVVVDAR